MLTTFNDDRDLLKKLLMTKPGCMAMTLKSKPNHSNEIVQNSQKSKKARSISVKCEGLVHCFLRLMNLCIDYAKQFIRNAQNYGKTSSHISMLLRLQYCMIAWCIMNSCRKVVWSIMNTTLKLCAD